MWSSYYTNFHLMLSKLMAFKKTTLVNTSNGIPGLCPWIFDHPLGKQLPISFISPEPFIVYPTKENPNLGGSELQVEKLRWMALRP